MLLHIQAFYRDTCGFIFDILEILDEYKAKILQYHVENPQDPSANKAMLAMTKTLNAQLNVYLSRFKVRCTILEKGLLAQIAVSMVE